MTSGPGSFYLHVDRQRAARQRWQVGKALAARLPFRWACTFLSNKRFYHFALVWDYGYA
jgi:hypothetical protein